MDTVTRPSYVRSHLQQLESEAIFLMREVAARFWRPRIAFYPTNPKVCRARHFALRWLYCTPYPSSLFSKRHFAICVIRPC